MIRSSRSGDSITFEVRVIPRSSKSEIVGEHDGALKIKLVSPPVEGAANSELVKFLAKTFGVAKSAVEIVAGQTSKRKTVRISGIGLDEMAAVLQSKT